MPSDPFYTRPAPGPSADDSVAENINRLEKIHERLNELQKTSNYTPKGKWCVEVAMIFDDICTEY